MLAIAVPVNADTPEQTAARLLEAERFSEAVEVLRGVVAKQPESVRLRLKLAEALAADRQWNDAVTEYQAVLNRQPNNTEALRGLGQVRRWQGHLPEARQAYEKAWAVAPNDAEVQLGLAATYRLDHDFPAAQKLYDEAQKKWPHDNDVQQAGYSFARERNPRVYLFFEDDLSFETRQLGMAVPFGAREEFGLEHQEEKRLQYQTGAETYSRTDSKLVYTHFLGLNHSLDADLRHAKYKYVAPATDFTAIDSFEEYRVRYTFPIVPEQVAAVRYSARPTTLVNSRNFTAHKLEAQITSQWTPRFQTLLGTGWLRDLDPNATSTSNMKSNSLVKAGVQADITNRFQVSAKYITNPDLDNTVDDTTLLQADYTFTGTVSGLVRHRADDYKQGNDQTSVYFGLRYVPNSHFWSEFGFKRVERGAYSSTDPLLSLVYRF
jgi:Flp pilus assembly protein TadD